MTRRGNPGGAYSLRLKRGALAEGINGSSSLGRFIRALQNELVAYVGGNPDIAQRLTIAEIIRCRVRLDELEKKIVSGKLTDRDRRLFSALANNLRYCLRELKPASSKNQPLDLETYLASKAADSDAREASTIPSVPRSRVRRPTG